MAERSGAQPGAAAKARISPAVIGLAPAGPGASTITGAEGNQLAAGRLALVLR